MDLNDLEKFKKILGAKREELESSLKSFATKDPNLKGDWDSKYPEFSRDPNVNLEDEASEVEEYVAQLPIEHAYELRVKAIDEALEKIEHGTYGECAKCKNPISIKRLEAYPEANLCLKCKE